MDGQTDWWVDGWMDGWLGSGLISEYLDILWWLQKLFTLELQVQLNGKVFALAAQVAVCNRQRI